MKLSRDTALKIHWIFDQLVPPILRDCKWFMWLPIKILYRHQAHLYFKFRSNAHNISVAEYDEYYRRIAEVRIDRVTDLNTRSVELILAHVKGPKVLEVGCGQGYMAHLLQKAGHDMMAVDMAGTLVPEYGSVPFQRAHVEALPFQDKQFDTVVCTHVLEHVLDFQKAVAELRRVARHLVIVVPRQREYTYTFDLHLNFFPYNFSFMQAMHKTDAQALCLDADGDIFYVEDITD